jgi:hypothetical protein
MPTTNNQKFQVRTNSVIELNQTFQDLEQRLYAQQRQLDQMAAAPPVKVPTASETASALQAGGGAPLNVANLTGVLAQVQYAAIPVVTALPPVNASQTDQVVFMSGHIYHFQAGSPGAWSMIL